MYISSLFFMASAAMAASLGSKEDVPFGCGAPAPAEMHINMTKTLRAREVGLNERRQVNSGQINIETYVHVVSADQSLEGGNLPPDLVQNQMRIMNQQYASTGISFTLRDIDWTYNPDWATMRDEMGMKSALRRGSYDTLNIYYVTHLERPGLSGFCYYPDSNTAPNSPGFIRDGCIVVGGTVPGAPQRFNANNDMVTTHEVGHWMGLFHTFEGNSCWGPGDYVDDTPQQASATRGCPRERKSCPGAPGLDPIHNYMDYAAPPCAREFTAGQINRMKGMWQAYRQGRGGGWQGWYPQRREVQDGEGGGDLVWTGEYIPERKQGGEGEASVAGGYIAETVQEEGPVEADAELPSLKDEKKSEKRDEQSIIFMPDEMKGAKVEEELPSLEDEKKSEKRDEQSIIFIPDEMKGARVEEEGM
ncbi:hypothetical protein CDD81_6045 [Ophiocordyceps australis]|uniref:Peptidase M43 pregnancy-associated plasma-A domain-containing protein n=1 Tax=Ophiocordyceps australis TaxID=1399860 RepID=A0A2C5XI04_9HYPO|nr:hypothetical protein CDD81_6045 [Ophiocordyceps australis]